ncbi:hypothetical protein [Aeromicrobium sp.]|uniref:hypothetical protein n=1 Tax=Aeromicrobium sp. TaxID=1871063 RepID=UPI0028AF89D0|nr:hypothetical protein [Aeromicrobium sp.]
MTNIDPVAQPTRPEIALVVTCLLDPTIPRPAREAVHAAFATLLEREDQRTMQEASFALTVAVRALPKADPWRRGGMNGDPYDGLASDAWLYWGEDEVQRLVRRFDGITPDAHTVIRGTGTAVTIRRALRWTPPDGRADAFCGALAALWRRLSSYGVTVPQFVMALSRVGDDLSTSRADAVASTIRPPDGLVAVVTDCPARQVDPPGSGGRTDFGEPPF